MDPATQNGGEPDAKRARNNDPAYNETLAMRMQGVGGNPGTSGGSGTGGGTGGRMRGMPILDQIPRKIKNKYTKAYTKTHYWKVYANDWLLKTSANQPTDIVGFMSIIPYEALCMYLSPVEYLNIIKACNYAKIKRATMQVKFKSVRTPFAANAVDRTDANGNLQFEIKTWRGLEKMMPFARANVAENGDLTYYNTYVELINRIYGEKSFSKLSADYRTWPAVMRERGLDQRPVWRFNLRDQYADANAPSTAVNIMYVPINHYISSLPVGEYIDESLNTNLTRMDDGYCFNNVYEPKNGIIHMATSAYAIANTIKGANATTRVNIKTRMKDTTELRPTSGNPIDFGNPQYYALFPTATGSITITGNLETAATTLPTSNDIAQMQGQRDSPTTCGTLQRVQSTTAGETCLCLGGKADYSQQNPPVMENVFARPASSANVITDVTKGSLGAAIAPNTGNDNVGYGSMNTMGQYAIMDLENYSIFTAQHDPPIHKMDSWMIGGIPKTNRDESIVAATFEFEITTLLEVEMEDCNPTYLNMTYNPVADGDYPVGYIDSYYDASRVAQFNWQQQEIAVPLLDNKFWNKSYGLSAQPLFNNLPTDQPLF